MPITYSDEVNVYNADAIQDGIDGAAQTADLYISEITDITNSGISVHRENDTSNAIHIRSSLIDIISNGVSRLKAFIEGGTPYIRLGEETTNHLLISNRGFSFMKNNGVVMGTMTASSNYAYPSSWNIDVDLVDYGDGISVYFSDAEDAIMEANPETIFGCIFEDRGDIYQVSFTADLLNDLVDEYTTGELTIYNSESYSELEEYGFAIEADFSSGGATITLVYDGHPEHDSTWRKVKSRKAKRANSIEFNCDLAVDDLIGAEISGQDIIAERGEFGRVGYLKCDVPQSSLDSSRDAYISYQPLSVIDTTGRSVGYVNVPFYADGTTGFGVSAKRTVNGTDVYNAIVPTIKNNGERAYIVSNPAGFRTAIGVGSLGTKSSASLSTQWATASASKTIAATNYAKIEPKVTIPSGYSPVGVASVQSNHTSACQLTEFDLDTDGTVHVTYYNRTSSAQSVTCTVQVICAKVNVS